ncbi:response regulator [Xenophilus aerolatus]
MPALRIFLVEENATIRDSLIPTLEELAAAQVVADAGGEDDAARWLVAHAGAWDLAVVDLFLAQGSGLGVLRHLRARGPSQRAVVLSNYATADMRRRCREAGADAVFDKSNELEAFIDYCNRLSAPGAA